VQSYGILYDTSKFYDTLLEFVGAEDHGCDPGPNVMILPGTTKISKTITINQMVKVSCEFDM